MGWAASIATLKWLQAGVEGWASLVVIILSVRDGTPSGRMCIVYHHLPVVLLFVDKVYKYTDQGEAHLYFEQPQLSEELNSISFTLSVYNYG